MKAIATSFVAALALAGGVAQAHRASFADSDDMPFQGVYVAEVHGSPVVRLSQPFVGRGAAATIVAQGGDPDDSGQTMLADGGDPDDNGRTMLADGGDDTRTQLA